MTSLRIWDLPTRLFHWCFAISIIGAFITVKLGGLYMDWHVRFGLIALGLAVFRIIWGFIGPLHARFLSFVPGPAGIWAYLRDMKAGVAVSAGHNPLGALSVLTILADMGIQAALGLFSSDDIMVQGPLYGLVKESTASFLTSLHRYNQWIMIALITLHLLAVIWHTLAKKEPLVRAMVTGDMPTSHLPANAQASADNINVRLRGLILAIIVAALVMWVRSLGA